MVPKRTAQTLIPACWREQGMGEIRAAADRLEALPQFRAGNMWVLPLHSTVSPADQRKVLPEKPCCFAASVCPHMSLNQPCWQRKIRSALHTLGSNKARPVQMACFRLGNCHVYVVTVLFPTPASQLYMLATSGQCTAHQSA